MDNDYLEQVRQQLEFRTHLQNDFEAFCRHVLKQSGQEPQPHHLLIIKELQTIADTPNGRLMMFAPPGSAKSTYASVLFPAWYLARGRRDIIGASYNAELAEVFSTKIRRHVEEFHLELGFNLRDDSRSRERWETTNGGVFRAAGCGTGITGHRADLEIIDDPHKNLEEAYSPAFSQRVWDVFCTDLSTRLKGGGKLILIQTRWSENDLAGRILEAEPGRWRVLRLPALAEDDDPLGRAVGEPLWPSEYPLEKLNQQRALMGEKLFAALYQGTPQPMDGNLFKVQKIKSSGAINVDDIEQTVRAWDLASGTRHDADYTVGLKLAKLRSGAFVIQDVKRFRGEPQDVEAAILGCAREDGKSTKISLPEDPGAAGKQVILYMTRMLAGYNVESSRETGHKVTRATPVSSQVNVGNLSIIDAAWNGHFLQELSVFPGGKHDDCIDALSRAFNAVIQPPAKAKFFRAGLMAR